MIKKLRGLWTPRHKTDWDIGTFMATERDIVQAIYWYQESAKGGYEAGMLHLAEYYKNRKQYKEAVVPSICRSKNQVAERTPWMIVLRGGVIYLHIMNVSKRKECEYDRSI